jgi:hypothetical protein
LGGAEEFEAYHEFSHGCRAEKRRVEVQMEEPLGVRLVVGGRGMEAHGVREGRVEDAVVGAGDLLEEVGEAFALGGGQVFNAGDVLFGKQEKLEGPDGPEGNECGPGFVFGDDAIALG